MGVEPTESCFAGSRRTLWLRRLVSVLTRNRTWSSTFAESRAIRHTPRTYCCSAARRGIEPRLADPKSAVRSSTLTGHEYPDLDLNQGLDLRRVQCYPLHHRDIFFCQYPDLESNQDQDLRRVLCCPLHHRDTRDEDWICTSMSRFTKPVPSCSATSAKARARGVEPRAAVLEAACSPRSTLV